VVDEARLIEDMKFFMIDQRLYNPNGSVDYIGQIANKFHGFGPSNTAYNLFGGPRIGTIGWKNDYWDSSEQYQNQQLVNQVHHFIAFFIIGYEEGRIDIPLIEAIAMDLIPFNYEDIRLAEIAIIIGVYTNKKALNLDILSESVYELLGDKNFNQHIKDPKR
jgi:hypothetical protein